MFSASNNPTELLADAAKPHASLASLTLNERQSLQRSLRKKTNTSPYYSPPTDSQMLLVLLTSGNS